VVAYGPYLGLQLAHAFLVIGDRARMDTCLRWSQALGSPAGHMGGSEAAPSPRTHGYWRLSTKNWALLTDPWVFGSARQGGAVAAEGEHGQGDECLRGAESERNPGQESDLGVGGFDQSLG
jgi:hypothetical protein